MITQEITFHAPGELSEVLALLAEHRDDAKILGGGMSLVPTMNLGLARPEILISINHVRDLAGIEERDDEIALGAATRHADVATSPLVARHCAVLAEAARLIGDVQVRNRGTIGGSVAHADPAADYLPVLAVLDASVVVTSATAQRVIPATHFFVDIMLTALEPDELVTEIRIPKLSPTVGAAYRRLARVEGSFAIVNAAAVVGNGSARVAIGGVAGRPIVVDLREATRGEINAGTLDAAAAAVRAACGEPYEDLNGDAEYRREMAAVFAGRALEAAAERIAA